RFTGSPPDETTRPNMDGNPMWDLLGVRYVVTAPGDGVSPFLNRAFAAVAPAGDLRPDVVELGGDRRQSLLMHGTQQLVYPVYEGRPGAVSFLYAAAGPPGASATLSVEAVTPGGLVPVWRAAVGVGAGAPAGWQRGQADLGKVAGPISALLLRSETAGTAADGFWADLQIQDPDRPGGANRLQSRPTEGQAQVFEDVGTLPRAFVVHRARPVPGPAEAIAEVGRAGARFADGAIRVEAFDPSAEAIVEAAPGDLAGLTDPAGAQPEEPRTSTRITSYRPNRVEITTRTDAPALLVLTDVFYPGWTVTVNGRKAKVLATDVAFRGVRVGEGYSRVVFAYQPTSFRLGQAIAAVALVATAAALLRSGVVRRRAVRSRAG
ncbi:MAG TPA: YfhO family protein, partial [Actinomycetota bacterium]